jgi:hypothetical protein
MNLKLLKPETRTSNFSSAGRKEKFVHKDDMCVSQVNEHDVVFGRGGFSYFHPGNRLFRRLVQHNKGLFESCDKACKRQSVALSIVCAIERLGGRFLRKETEHKSSSVAYWKVVPKEDACIKTAQALRDANVRRRKCNPSKKNPRNSSTSDILNSGSSEEGTSDSKMHSDCYSPANTDCLDLDGIDQIDLETIDALVRSLASDQECWSRASFVGETLIPRTSSSMKEDYMQFIDRQNVVDESQPGSSLIPQPVITRSSITSLSILEADLLTEDFAFDEMD